LADLISLVSFLGASLVYVLAKAALLVLFAGSTLTAAFVVF